MALTLPDRLRRARVAAGLSQRDLAERAGVPQSTVARIERGHIDPRWTTVEKLFAACDREVVVVVRPGRGVDRTLFREMLKLSPEERIQAAAAEAKAAETLANAVPVR